MPLEQTVTIVNNSGKIIRTGKQLFSIFKEAKGAYQDKKAELQSERSAVRRCQTFDTSRSVYRNDDSARSEHANARRQIRDGYDDDDDDGGYDYKGDYHDYKDAYEEDYNDYNDYKQDHGHDDYNYSYGGPRHSHDVYSEAGSRRTRRSSRHGRDHGQPRGGALTERNLKTLSEVSSTTPSGAQQQRQPPSAAYRTPYAETMPLDMALSKLDLSRPPPRRSWTSDAAMLVPRRRSEPELAKDIDMNLAYGNIPPDLADRVDLDPGPELDGTRAQQLVYKVEGLLDEAHCLQHSATTIIKSLQEKPDAAAEVALTLADLSSAVAKMSPSLLGLLKGGSPAVFALLASPQFLIGTGIAVGVTVVMFGGWRIVKKVAEARAPREAMALEGVPQDRPAPLRTQTDYTHDYRQSGGVEEALVVDDALSTIETWRRGILPFGPEAETADLELITPQADRATRQKYAKDDIDIELRSYRSSRTRKSSKSHGSKRPKDSPKEGPKESGGREKVPLETRSSAGGSRRRSPPEAAAASVSGGSDARSRRSGKGAKDKAPKALEGGGGGGSSKGDGLDGVFRARARHGDNMLKAIFRNKKEKEAGGGGSRRELVLA